MTMTQTTGLSILAMALASCATSAPGPVETGQEPAAASETIALKQDNPTIDSRYAQHLKQLESRLPPGFSVVVERPFVVIGDEPEETVRRRAEGTVRWTVEKLKQDFFTTDPDHIIDIWLFKDEASYLRYALELFGDTPDTPYGYYSESSRAMVMNIATGGGTLVHEMVHPFMAANFPDCPAWFNEGLGSLYEQSSEREGHIWGLTNWRLDGLKKAIRTGVVPSFEFLLSRSSDDFYGKDPGTNYAQSRYLLQYLQEEGLLVEYYRGFHANQAKDPTGIETLRSVLGENDLEAFKGSWERWVTGLER